MMNRKQLWMLPLLGALTLSAGHVTTVQAAPAGVTQTLDTQEQRLRQTTQNIDGISYIRTADTLKMILPSAVTFANDKATLAPAAQTVLTQVAGIMREFPDTGIIVDGYTDSTGRKAYNQRLSEVRAQSVATVLAQGGVAMDKLQARGHGASAYVASNANAAGRAKNRRVTLTLVPPRYDNQPIPAQTIPGQ